MCLLLPPAERMITCWTTLPEAVPSLSQSPSHVPFFMLSGSTDVSTIGSAFVPFAMIPAPRVNAAEISSQSPSRKRISTPASIVRTALSTTSIPPLLTMYGLHALYRVVSFAIRGLVSAHSTGGDSGLLVGGSVLGATGLTSDFGEGSAPRDPHV